MTSTIIKSGTNIFNAKNSLNVIRKNSWTQVTQSNYTKIK